MRIVYSRHALQRVKLYEIDTGEVERRLGSLDLESIPANEKRSFVFENVHSRVGKPIKVVLVKENDELVIVTTYPVKRGLKI